MQYSILLIPLFFLSLIFLLKRFRSSQTKSNLPPSPPRLPVIGNLHQLGTLPHRSLQTLSNKYGPLMLMKMGQVPTLVVSSSQMVKEIVKNYDVVFSDRPKTTAADILLYGCQDPGFAPYGEYWKKIRKICVVELLSHKRVHEFEFVRVVETNLLVDRISRACHNDVGEPLNLSKLLVGTSNNIVSMCILGQRFEDENGQSKFGDLTRRFMEDFMAFSVQDFFPTKYARWIDVVRGLIGRLKSNFRELDTFYDQVVEEHKAGLKSSDGGSHSKDFLDILLALQKDDFDLTQDSMKAILMDLFVGGSDTTSTALEWLMAELVKSPRVMKKAQEEIRRVVGNKGKIDMNDINQMEFLQCVIKEGLRLHPPAVLLVPRKTMSNAELGGYNVPENTRVFINAWAVQRDPTVWDKPDEFIPERFENNPIEFKLGQDFELIPFGFGRRGCPGLEFGVTSLQYMISNLLYWFDWKIPTNNANNGDDDQIMLGEELDMDEVYGLTVHKKTPLYLIPSSYAPFMCTDQCT
ncbi:phenylacetaldehyde oxime monooxygenase CYP71AN24-like [Humulus lupulus]|uniref:phenylacetaldehyde oxime monooxygenase CYP71AN24-like n=1 Tax=Humulus lupulus TaxID=3486 RepID=UPI002B401742|nr:phenylacetaldehyde oxime monooxygenase CYP71AN24-like [Humulus lupulus]